VKIAVIGAGAIGSVVGGLLAKAGEDVTLIARPAHAEAVNANGLLIEGPDGSLRIPVHAQQRLDFTPDLALLTVKTHDVTAVAREVQPYVADVPLVTMQNGTRSDDMVAEVLGRENILSCVVMLVVTFLDPGRVTYVRPGALVLGVPFGPVDQRAREIANVLGKAVPTSLTDNIRGAHWTKLIVNENNALPAITGLSVQEIDRRPEMRRLATILMKEAAATIRAAGIRLDALPQLPAFALEAMLGLPTPMAVMLSRLMSRSLGSTPVLGSTLQSVRRGKKTEIDYLNGEVVALGRSVGRATPYNEAVVGLVHQVEATGTFLTPEQVIAALA